MSFKSLDGILSSLEKQSGWQEQPFPRVLGCWAEVVGAAVAARTQPVSIHRQVLFVATSSAVWAQELSFRRQQILEKLNTQLVAPLQDIRFSTAGWQPTRNSSLVDSNQAKELWRKHPSMVVDVARLPRSSQLPQLNSPNAAFQNWAEAIKMRSHNLPLCPQCRCPTPKGELERWAVCSLCATKKW